MSVKERARQLVVEMDAKDVEDARKNAEREENERQAREARAKFVLMHAPIHEWFPDSTFEIMNYHAKGCSLQYESDGSEIIVRSDDGVEFALSMNLRDSGWGETPPCEVHVVKLHTPTGYYASDGPYYTGPKVESAEDVARTLKAWGAL